MSQIWDLCSCECQCESPVRVIKCILGKLWGLVSAYERSPVIYIGQAHLQAVTPSQSFFNTVIFELKSAAWLRAAGSGSSPTRGPLPHVSLRFPVSLLYICRRQKKAKNIYFFKVPDLHPPLCTIRTGKYSQYEAQHESKSVVRFQSV